MAYSAITEAETAVGKSFKKELADKLRLNLADHETRLNALSIGSGPITIFNEDILNTSTALTLTGVLYYKAINDLQITKAQIQIFGKDGISSGTLDFDLKKSATLGGTFTSIFTTKPTINYATALAYDANDGVLNTGQSVTQDQIIRLDITNVPTGVITKFRVMVYGALS